MSENLTRQSMNFMRPFDGTQPEIATAEQMQAASEFKTLAEDTMLANMQDVRVYNNEGPSIPAESQLRMQLDAEDGSQLWIYLDSQNPDDAEQAKPYKISLLEVCADGLGRKDVSYELARDYSHVTRKDITEDGYADMQRIKQHEPDINPERTPLSGMIVHIENKIAAAQEAIQNQELAKSMGVYDQPVGLDEVHAVAALVSAAESKPLF